jgi:hypothetical protein
MKDAVQNLGKPLEAGLGGNSGGKSLRKKTQNNIMRELLVRLLKPRNVAEKQEDFSENTGGRSRT